MKDMLGNELRVGDRVAWGVKGSVRLGYVTEVDFIPTYAPMTKWRWCRTKGEAGKPGGLFRNSHVVRVLEP